MSLAAVRAAEAMGYEGAGTVEFLVDGDNFYFMEMNTRIQVEHGVTELVTGVDLVRQQLRIASGLPLDFAQDDVTIRGCAIECRINAEDPKNDFRPCPGKVEFLHFPGGAGVRVDSCLYNGCVMSPYYDSLAAKLLAHGSTRLEAVRKMRRCLEEFMLVGFPTNAELSYEILFHPVLSGGAVPRPSWTITCRSCWSSAAGWKKRRRMSEKRFCQTPGPAPGHEGHPGQLYS